MADLDLVGRTIAGKYSIESRVGSGAMGAVFRARHNALEQAVAVKVMHPDIASEKTFAARFKREAMTTVRLSHPNSIRLFDFGEEPDGLLYLVMEYIDGRDLSAVLANEWPLSTARIVSMIRQVLGALSAAHDVGIVHRDLKPENILVVEAEDDEQRPTDLVKVCDFGIATMGAVRVGERGSGERRLITSGLLMGTPEYMSPEQARGEPTDARSDVYSVGVILYEMLTRRVPFAAENALGVALQHVSTEPLRPSSIREGIDPNLEAICLEALVKDVRRRFQSAREMRAALASVVAVHRAGDRSVLADSDATIAPPAIEPNRTAFNDDADTKKTIAPPESERAAVASVPRLRPVIIASDDPVESAQRRAVTLPRMRPAPPAHGVDSSPHVAIVPKAPATASRPGESEQEAASSPRVLRLHAKRIVAGLLVSSLAAAILFFVRLNDTTRTVAHAPSPTSATTGAAPNALVAPTSPISPSPSNGVEDDRGEGLNSPGARPAAARPASHPLPPHPAAITIANAPHASAPQVSAAVSTGPIAPSPAIAATTFVAAPIAAAPAAAPSARPILPQATAIQPAAFDASNGRASVSVSSTDAVLKRDVTAAVSRNVAAVTACYQAELRAVAAPRTGSGTVHIDINETGSVRAARASIGFATASLARCVERAFIGVRIAGVDTGSASADLSVTFDLK